MKTILIALALVAMPSFAEAHEDQMMCTMQYAPVCGTENGVYKTYGNSCVLSSEGATYQHEGECTAAELNGKQRDSYVPPAHCTAWFDGCNSCGRDASGQSFCTLRACMDEPAAGYCTAYAESEPEPDTVTHPTPGGSASSESTAPSETSTTVEATTSATTTEARPGFLERVWSAISSWFGSLF